MKKISIFFLLLCMSATLSSEEFPLPFNSSSKEQLKVYWCSRLTNEVRAYNNQLRASFDERFSLFLPQDVDLSLYSKEKKHLLGYVEDLKALNKADLLLLIVPYGRDCSWEVGWASGRGLLTIAYIEDDLSFLEDSMIKESLHFIITPSKKVHRAVCLDPALTRKCLLISSRNELSDLICDLHESFLFGDVKAIP
jgi:hypothetical protein